MGCAPTKKIAMDTSRYVEVCGPIRMMFEDLVGIINGTKSVQYQLAENAHNAAGRSHFIVKRVELEARVMIFETRFRQKLVWFLLNATIYPRIIASDNFPFIKKIREAATDAVPEPRVLSIDWLEENLMSDPVKAHAVSELIASIIVTGFITFLISKHPDYMVAFAKKIQTKDLDGLLSDGWISVS